MQLTLQIRQFQTYLKSEKRYSRHTCDSYVRDVEQCAYFLQATYTPGGWDEVDHRMLRSWLVTMSQKGLKARSMNRKVSSLKTFFAFLKKNGGVLKNPALKLTSLKTEKRLPATIGHAAIERLIELLRKDDAFQGIRDLLIIEILYQTGIRKAELQTLRHGDVDRSARVIKVTGKGNKQRVIPVGPGLVALIGRYEAVKAKEFPHLPSGFLLVTDRGKQMYPKFIYNRVTALLSMVSTAERRNPHVLRHSFATQLSDRGAELNAIKELLGHESLAATQVYTHNSIEKLKKAYRLAHPKS